MLPNDSLAVLVIEDSSVDAFLIRKLLEPRARLQIVSTLAEALQWLAGHTPDVILLDLSLPDVLDQMSALIALRSAYSQLPVVVLTGADKRLSEEALRMGAQDFLSKESLDADRLRRALSHARERNRLQQRLRESRDSFSSIVDHSSEGVLVVGADRLIRYANPRAERMLRRACPTLKGSMVPWPREDAMMFDLSICLPGGKEGIGHAHIARTVWAGAPAELITIRDVTHRRRDEQALREKNEQLERVRQMEAVGLLAAGTAHEFNNQLMIIQGFAELAEDTLGETHPVQSFLQRIRTAARRSSVITRQLTTMSSQKGPEARPARLGPLLRAITARLAPAPDVPITLELCLELPDAIAQVEGREVEQVLSALVSNACDAMPLGGSLDIGLSAAPPDTERADAQQARLWVRDTGTGMDDETRARAFQPFFTTKEVNQGTGLGLSMVYGIVQRWGASIDIEIRARGGVEVSIMLPLVSGLS
jgi:signal transduction histidine kinase/CheY-like chemotaxis protein